MADMDTLKQERNAVTKMAAPTPYFFEFHKSGLQKFGSTDPLFNSKNFGRLDPGRTEIKMGTRHDEHDEVDQRRSTPRLPNSISMGASEVMP